MLRHQRLRVCLLIIVFNVLLVHAKTLNTMINKQTWLLWETKTKLSFKKFFATVKLLARNGCMFVC